MNPSVWFTILAGSSLTFLAAAWLITSFCRLSAARKHLCWLMALAMPLLTFVVIPTGLHIKLPVLPAPPKTGVQPIAPAFDLTPPPTEPLSVPDVVGEPSAAAERLPSLGFGIPWAIGSLFVLGYLALSHSRLRRKMRRARFASVPERILIAADTVMRRGAPKAEILICDYADVPFCYGLFRRRIVLPIQVAEWSEETLRACLAHEFAHLRRHDLFSLALAQLACAALWFNPLAMKGANVPTKFIDERIDELVKLEFSGDREKFESALAKNGYTLENFREAELIKIQIQATKQTGIKEMFRDSPATSGEEFKQRETNGRRNSAGRRKSRFARRRVSE